MMPFKVWTHNIVQCLRTLASQDFQERVWLKGEGPEFSSYEEEMCRFFDDNTIHLYVDVLKERKAYEAVECIESLMAKLDGLSETLPDRHPETILRRSEWPDIRANAGRLIDCLVTLMDKNDVAQA